MNKMDDDLEDDVLYQTLLSHIRLISRFLISFPMNSTSVAYFSRFVCFYLSRPETLVLGIAVIIVLFLCHSTELWLKTAFNKFPFSRFGGIGKTRFPIIVNPAELLSEQQAWDLDKDNVAVYAIRGRRPHMEDRYSVLGDESSGISLYGIFDGHGGESAAEFVEKSLFNVLLSRLQHAKNQSQTEKKSAKNVVEHDSDEKSTAPSLTSEFSHLLTEEILAVDSRLLSKAKATHDVAGTTALVAVMHGNQLIVANVGDSRGVICDNKGTAIPLSFDHKPQQLKEHRRIKEAGGFITFNGVWRVAGILATSRALGDFPLKDRNLIIAEPDILTFNLEDLRPQFMILATDGLWDAFTNEEAVAYIREHLNESHLGAKSITQQAYYRGSLDNITVLVVDFRNCTVSRTSNKEE